MNKLFYVILAFLLLPLLVISGLLGVLYFQSRNEVSQLNEDLSTLGSQSSSDLANNDIESIAQPNVTSAENNGFSQLLPDLNYFLYTECNVAVPVSRKMNSEDYSNLDIGDQGRKWEIRVLKQQNSFGTIQSSVLTIGLNPSREAFAQNGLIYSNGYNPANYSISCDKPNREISDLDDFFAYKRSQIEVDNSEILLVNEGIITKWGNDVLQYSVKNSAGEAGKYYLAIVNDKYYQINYLGFTNNPEIQSEAELAFNNIIFY